MFECVCVFPVEKVDCYEVDHLVSVFMAAWVLQPPLSVPSTRASSADNRRRRGAQTKCCQGPACFSPFTWSHKVWPLASGLAVVRLRHISCVRRRSRKMQCLGSTCLVAWTVLNEGIAWVGVHIYKYNIYIYRYTHTHIYISLSLSRS